MKIHPVYFVLPPQTLLLDLAGPAEALWMANRYQKEVRFELHYAAPTRHVETSIGLQVSAIEKLPKRLPATAMIVVAGAGDAVPKSSHGAGLRARLQKGLTNGPDSTDNEGLQIVDWLRSMAHPERKFVFICSGALLAARAGFLDHRACTTHHTDCDELRRLAVDAKVYDNRIYVEDGNIYTSAGVTAGIDLMLHLIGKMAGPRCAVAVARNMVVYLRRGGADPQLSPWLEGRNHLHPSVHRLQDAIAHDPAHPWTLQELSDLAHASPRHITRLFQLHAGSSPVQYINRLRLALAREMLANSEMPLESVADRAGFGSARHLRRIWRQFNSTPPSRWRSQ